MLMPSMMKRKVSSMSLMRGMDTRRCDATSVDPIIDLLLVIAQGT